MGFALTISLVKEWIKSGPWRTTESHLLAYRDRTPPTLRAVISYYEDRAATLAIFSLREGEDVRDLVSGKVHRIEAALALEAGAFTLPETIATAYAKITKKMEEMQVASRSRDRMVEALGDAVLRKELRRCTRLLIAKDEKPAKASSTTKERLIALCLGES